MALPERLLDQQFDRLQGSRTARIEKLRRNNGLLLLACAFNGLAVLAGLLSQDGKMRTVWIALGVFWLMFLFFLLRQRRHLEALGTSD